MTASPFHLNDSIMNFSSARSVMNFLIRNTRDVASPGYNWIFVLWLEPAINTYWRTEHTLVHWVLKSDSGYYVVVDLQQNHLNYELREEELIEFEMLRLMVLQTVINTKSKAFPRDVGIKRCSTAPQTCFMVGQAFHWQNGIYLFSGG